MSSTTATVTAAAAPKGAETALTLKAGKEPVEKFRLDYRPADFEIDFVDLDFVLHPTETLVTSVIDVRRRLGTAPCDLVLDGEQLTLLGIWLDGVELREGLEKGGYREEADGSLRVSAAALPAEAGKLFKLKTQVRINPKENLKLSGLYRSGNLFVTQCEAEGFRRITYFLDRPDVMSLYKVRIEASKEDNPVLLSNGNMLSSGSVQERPSHHFAVFQDPHPKPCYLFALVAGNLSSIQADFQTMGGRRVSVEVFAEKREVPRLDWALKSVLKSMKWDEEAFGREYDLDAFRVVCVADFNMGAMENKGLNIFNSSLLLAHPDTTTDAEFETILAVVGHEYFHNWTGNRITCRDWFQLTLKEGLTVFREQLFAAAMGSEAVERINQVRTLRSFQFVEDAGPMAHPIRPESYIAMDNFYTATVYDKGAEVIRMYYTLLGKEGFRKGMDLYFERHDGQAVTCDDFRKAMADANGRNLDQFERWYLQAGTPELEVLEAVHSPEEKTFTLRLRQHTPPTPKQPVKLPVVIPVAVGLVGRESKKDLLSPPTQVLEMTEAEQTFVLENVEEAPVLSLLRGFSAPVRVKNWQSEQDLSFLMAFDSDFLNKWQAAQTLATQAVMSRAEFFRQNAKSSSSDKFPSPPPLPNLYTEAFREALERSSGTDSSVLALTLQLPDWKALEQEMHPVDVDALHEARKSAIKELGSLCSRQMTSVYSKLTLPRGSEEVVEGKEVARRQLRNTVLSFLASAGDAAAAELAFQHFSHAGCMTDRLAALRVLCNIDSPQRQQALDAFYESAKGDELMVDKWFSVQAASDLDGAVERVEKLLQHPAFTYKRPDRLRAVFRSFASNAKHFHRKDGKGYKLVADAVLEVDSFNGLAAARLARTLMDWRKFDSERQSLMRAELQRIHASPSLSPDTLEIVQKALAEAPSA